MAAFMRAGLEEEELAVGDDGALLGANEQALGNGDRRWRFAKFGAALSALGVIAGVALLSFPQSQQEPSSPPLRAEAIQGKPVVEPLAEPTVQPGKAQERWRSKPKLMIEEDLRELITSHLPSTAKPGVGESHDDFSGSLFDHVMLSSGLHLELTHAEQSAFKSRFVESMTSAAKQHNEFEGPLSRYIKSAQDAIESQKPVVTEAVAQSLNDAGLGFSSKMQDWMVHESKQLFERRLGRTPLPDQKAKELSSQRKAAPTSTRNVLPTHFDAREKWPQCADVIGRIHNQGHCGSCWVFGALGPLDSRLCIKTKDAKLHFDGELAVLSRGYAASCATTGDGCKGGWEYYVYEYIEKSAGIPTQSCSPYFAHGPGSEHFDSNEPAPSCPEECDARFPQTMLENDFKPAGVGNYQLVVKPNADDLEHFKAAMYEGGPVAFGIYAHGPFMSYTSGIYGLDCGADPNHAVQAIGWGEGYFLGQNSWGPEWGDAGRFKVAPCVPTDFTIPGAITEDQYPLPIPAYTLTTSSTTPLPAPDPSTSACKTDDEGCVTSPNWPEAYGNSQECIISYKFGKIDVRAFNTEAVYDYLMVNDQKYSGTEGPQGVVPVTNILWSSDFDLAWGNGWKICPMEE